MLYPWLQPYFEQFLTSLKSGRMSSSVIIAGDYGLGGRYLALQMAKTYLCPNKSDTGPCHQCRSCQSFERLMNKDLKVAYSSTLEESKKDYDFTYDCSGLMVRDSSAQARSLRIDTMRKIPEFIYEAPAGGVGKVVIIDNAELMSTGAANAILKTFEEPQVGTMIIMLTHSLEQLLPTILSRAVKIVLKEIDGQQALDFLLNKDYQKPMRIKRMDISADEHLSQEQKDIAACPGLQTPIDLVRAQIALALNSYAPLSAMKMLLKGDDIKVLQALSALVRSINTQDPYDLEVLTALEDLDKDTQVRLLRQLVLEILKYKAYVPIEQLPLVRYSQATCLERLSAEHLFEAYDMLSHLEDRPGLIAARAPRALMRVWLQAFKADMK